MTKRFAPRVLLQLAAVALSLAVASCREESVVYPPEHSGAGTPQFTSITGFYLLNEGNMGSNKATLDYYDYRRAEYVRNIYGAANPGVPMELGDVGNDLRIYRGRLYAVINCSNKVEVMDAADARRIGQVDIPNCRHIEFDGDYAYVTSYAGPVEIKPDYEQRGYVAKIDLATLREVDRCLVGFQPDGLAIHDGRMYVANSGGYMVPNYENTLSVIDLASFRETGRIEIAPNLQRVIADGRGRLWVSSRGDYYTHGSHLYCYDIASGTLTEFDVPVSDMDLCGDLLYIVSAQWSYETMSNQITSCVFDTGLMRKVRDSFITDGAERSIRIPYGVKVNPLTGEVLVTDAGNYVNPGWLYCFSPDGRLCWDRPVRTGDIPAHIAFTGTLDNSERN